MSLKIEIPIVKPLPRVIEPRSSHHHQENIKNNLEKLEKRANSNWGGKRKGAGRRKSELTILSAKEKREILHKVLSETDDNNISNYEQIVRILVAKAKKDVRVASYILDQTIGKAAQAVQLEPDPNHKIVTILPAVESIEDRKIIDLPQ